MNDNRNTEAYAQLETLFARRHHLGQAAGMLSWDQRVMMPDGAAQARGETLATLAGMAHGMLIGPETGDLLDAAEAEAEGLDEWRAANLALMRRAYIRATAAPRTLVEAMSRAESAGEMAWRSARAEDDFAAFLPALSEVLRLKREHGAVLAEALGLSVYDALMDQYEPGATAARIDPLFDDLAGFLPDLLQSALERQAAQPTPEGPAGPFPVGKQRALGERLMRAVGFDFERGRLDVSLHPFCGGADDDVRITTRYDEADFFSALMGVLHETGHALYEQGLPREYASQPVGGAAGLALHESQSLLIEMQVCRGPEFLGFAAPLMAEAFGGDASAPEWRAETLGRISTRVARGFIRVDSDEITYPLHVILRTRLERAMLSGDLAPADLPGAWREGMISLVGVAPPTDREGCLQDIHWADGAWGYFPTYTLGAMAAAQLYAAAKAARPEIPEAVGRGDFTPLVGWLRTEVHGRASLLDTDGLLTAATGAPLSTAAFKAHLTRRYGG